MAIQVLKEANLLGDPRPSTATAGTIQSQLRTQSLPTGLYGIARDRLLAGGQCLMTNIGECTAISLP